MSTQAPRDCRIEPGDGHPAHGTVRGYEYYLCSCPDCARAYYERHQVYRAKYLAEMQANPDDHRHGTLTGYSYGCKCVRCAEARRINDRSKSKSKRKVSA